MMSNDFHQNFCRAIRWLLALSADLSSVSKLGVMTRSLTKSAVAVAALCFATVALAEPIAEAEEALRKRDASSAIRILEQASTEGNVVAKGRLASYLRTFPPPYRNLERGCTLAREASDAGDPMGSVTRAECLITGTEKADQPFVQARELARKALKSGFPAAGFTLYVTFTMDPRYSYSQDGKADITKYNALAAMPISARGDQIDAYDGLADAIRAGHVNAAFMALGYLIDSSAPGNIDRVLGFAAIMQKNGEQLPQRLLPAVRLAQEIKRLGSTHASVSAFNNAYQSALFNATMQLRGLEGNSTCDTSGIKLMGVKTGPINNPEYLPISKMPLSNTFLVRGSWNEDWTFIGCEKSVVIQINFTADGWSGAHFNTTYSPNGGSKQ